MICPAGQGPDLFETIEGCPQRPKKEIHEGSPSETVLRMGRPAARQAGAPPPEEQEGWEQSPPGSAGVPPAPVRAQPGPTPPARIKREPGHGSPPTPTEAASAGRVDSRGGGERMRAGRPRSRGHPAGLSRIRPVCSPCCAPASRPVDPVYRCSMLQQTELTGHGLCSP